VLRYPRSEIKRLATENVSYPAGAPELRSRNGAVVGRPARKKDDHVTMPAAQRPSRCAAFAVLAAALAILAAALLLSGSLPAQAATQSQLQQRITAGQGRVSALAGAVRAAGRQAQQLGATAGVLTARLLRLQANLNARQAELLRLRSQLDATRKRLAQLVAYEKHAERVLAQQLVGSYESSRPDIVSVVLDSNGFQNLLDGLSFEQRIGHHNAQIVEQVRAARRAVAAEATHLGVLTVRQQRLTTEVLLERNSVARIRIAIIFRWLAVIHRRRASATQLSTARGKLASLRSQLGRLLAAQAAATRAQSEGSPAFYGAPSSSGSFTFPLPTGAASPPATWSPDDGVDIAAPGGTPEYAVCSGTIVLHGMGGFGPSAPVLHCDSPLGGYDYVYYGHAGPGNWVPVGSHVSQGQVISEIGYGIVGVSTGPHLEIGFADSSGGPIGPSSAPAMLSLLRSAY
jgi:murein DD-endopeptidase MepM/ murein hydrolase activator NlpD